MTECILRAVLPIELTNGNDGRGSKWFSSAKTRKQIERNLRVLGHKRKPFAADYVNNHPHCLHIWKPTETEIPTPPSILVGIVTK